MLLKNWYYKHRWIPFSRTTFVRFGVNLMELYNFVLWNAIGKQRQCKAQNRCGLIFFSSFEKVAILRLYFEDNMIMMLQ